MMTARSSLRRLAAGAFAATLTLVGLLASNLAHHAL